MNTNKAIQTSFKGYRFRSRLEARYAVLFDALGLKWEYEIEGFDLGLSGWYLPDFWIPDWKSFVEIKPRTPQFGELVKPTAFSWEYGNNLILFRGSPWPGETIIEKFSPANKESGEEATVDWFGEIAQCRGCQGLCLLAEEFHPQPDVCSHGTFNDIGTHACDDCKSPVSSVHWMNNRNSKSVVANAYRAARSARFEHGETPR